MTTTRRSPAVSLRFRGPAQLSTLSGPRPATVCSSGRLRSPPAETKGWPRLTLGVSLPTSCCGIRRLMEPVSSVLSLDVNVHLLPHIQRRVLVFHAIDNLQNTRIHTFSAIACQRLLGNHVRLEAHELQRDFQRTVAPWRCHRRGTCADLPSIVLIHIHANMQRGDVSKDH